MSAATLYFAQRSNDRHGTYNVVRLDTRQDGTEVETVVDQIGAADVAADYYTKHGRTGRAPI